LSKYLLVKFINNNIVASSITLTNYSDVIFIGVGIMSATLAVILKELDPHLTIKIYEVLGSEAQESSNAWNNAGTGHAALCEMNVHRLCPNLPVDRNLC
jgi:malate dehydrogenase (quinone)